MLALFYSLRDADFALSMQHFGDMSFPENGSEDFLWLAVLFEKKLNQVRGSCSFAREGFAFIVTREGHEKFIQFTLLTSKTRFAHELLDLAQNSFMLSLGLDDAREHRR